MSDVVLNAEGVHEAIERICQEICEQVGGNKLAIVGIRHGGEVLAKRVAARIEAQLDCEIPVGFVDITLYRDDGFGRAEWPEVGVTEIPFNPTERIVVLVDDVLFTGRTVRAALDAILDYGRPPAIRAAVLVDRGLRELPIRADFIGIQLTTENDQHVRVNLTNTEEDDIVVVSMRTKQ